ncbi:MAG: fibronectin type III domain-containing protein [Bacteroidota bacterium]
MKTFPLFSAKAFMCFCLLFCHQLLIAQTNSQQRGILKTNRTTVEPPVFLRASFVSSPDRVVLGWDDFNNTSVDGYIVERENNIGQFQTIATVTGRGHTDDNIVTGRTYTYRVKAFVGDVQSIGSNIVTVTTGTPLSAPANLVSSLQTQTGSIALSWTDSNLDETGFSISRSVNNGSFTTIATISQTGSNLSYTDEDNIRRGTNYRYRVTARRGTTTSSPSNTASVDSGQGILNPPASVTGSYDPISASVQLTWTDDNADETGFIIERSANNNPFVEIDRITETGSNLSYEDNSAANQNDYRYRIKALKGTQTSSFSEIFTIEIDVDLFAPLNLTASYNSSKGHVLLNWEDINTDETAFEIERAIALGDFDPLQFISVTGSNLAFTDQTAEPGTIYRYRVRARRNGEASPFSNVASANTVGILQAPTNLTASFQTNGNSILLSWDDSNPDETGFVIDRKINNGRFNFYRQVNRTGSQLTEIDNAVNAANTYSYRVRAVEGGILSPYSNVATTSNSGVINAPSQLGASVLSSSQIRLNWTDNSNNETKFVISRARENGQYADVDQVGANQTTFLDTDLDPNTRYRYRIYAANATNNSGFSNPVAVRTFNSAPNAPTNFSASFDPVNIAVDFFWVDRSNNETGHEIEYKLTTDTNWSTLLVDIDGDVTSTTTDVSGIVGDQTYDLRIRATNAIGASPWSNVAQVYLPPNNPSLAPPSNFQASFLSINRSVFFTWSDNSTGETGFEIEFKEVTDTQWEQLLVNIPANATQSSTSVASVEGNRVFDVRIRAINSTGPSLWSNIDQVFIPPYSTASRLDDGQPLVGNQVTATAYPNPFKNYVSFGYPWLDEPAILIIKDVKSGKEISRIYYSGESALSDKVLRWDGTDLNGSQVKPGTYIYQIKSDQGSYFGRVIYQH